MPAFLLRPWPWYVSGALIGLAAPLLLLVGNKLLGMSASLRHLCAAVLPTRADFFSYDWRRVGGWNLIFALGVLTGGWIGAHMLGGANDVVLSAATSADLRALGVHELTGFVPKELYSWAALAHGRGLVLLVFGGLLVGFGAGYAGGCTSGHAISGVADLQPASMIAAAGFFAGGIVTSIYVLPLLLRV
jgi:uncharacterized membrane protein YedE/YeeE